MAAACDRARNASSSACVGARSNGHCRCADVAVRTHITHRRRPCVHNMRKPARTSKATRLCGRTHAHSPARTHARSHARSHARPHISALAAEGGRTRKARAASATSAAEMTEAAAVVSDLPATSARLTSPCTKSCRMSGSTAFGCSSSSSASFRVSRSYIGHKGANAQIDLRRLVQDATKLTCSTVVSVRSREA